MTITLTCPICGDESLEFAVSHDAGCYRTSNGDGWPESWECVLESAGCTCAHTDEQLAALEQDALDRAAEDEADVRDGWVYDEGED